VRTWIAALILVLVVAAAIAIKLFVRRRAPVGGWFLDSPRSAGTLSVIGTMFAVVLAFVIFLALQGYQRARQASTEEAVAISELHSVAALFEPPTRDHLQGGLVCYARGVTEGEWSAMSEGRSSEQVQAWIDRLSGEIAITEPHGAREQEAYAQWFDLQAQRREGRRGRLAVAVPLVPAPLWFVLGIGGLLMIGYMCAQADPREGLLVQSIPIGFVTTMVTAGMLVILFLDHPFANESGGIAPTEMRQTLARIDHGGAAPCDERGTARST
jgi:hypothetical protein